SFSSLAPSVVAHPPQSSDICTSTVRAARRRGGVFMARIVPTSGRAVPVLVSRFPRRGPCDGAADAKPSPSGRGTTEQQGFGEISMNDVAVPRRAGSVQGLVLLLPISMTVATVVLFTASVALMTERFRAIAHADYLVQLVITIPAIGILLFAPLAGWLTDAIGRRRILVGSMLAYAVFGCAPYFLENIYAILLTRCALGLCVSAVVTASTTMISDYFKGRARERWFAAQAAVSAISAVVLIWVGGRLGAAFGWRGPFLAYAYSVVLAIAIWALTWEPSEESPDELIANEDVSYTQFPLARMLGICIVTLAASITFYAVSTQNANALVTLGVHDPAEIGRLSAVATFGTVL